MRKIVFLIVANILSSSLLFGNETLQDRCNDVIVSLPSERGTTGINSPLTIAGLEVMEKEGLVVPKDPLIAGLLSVQLPGLGQIYCRHYLRGITYLAGEIGCYILAAELVGLETHQYAWTARNEETGEERKLTQEITINKWNDLSGLERTGVVSLIIGGIGLHIWNVIDAYHLAQEHNIRLGWVENIDVQLGFKDSTPSLKFAVSKKF